MSIYLFRHGEAFQIGEKPEIQNDEERPLTPKGINVTKEVCQGLRKLKVSCDEVWHSPLVRAVETAEIVAGEMGCDRLIEKEGLAYDVEMESLFRSLKDVDPAQEVFLVGHQPYMAEWTVRLIAGCVTDAVSVTKSGVVCLDLIEGTDPPRAELRWLLRAKQLQLIGKA